MDVREKLVELIGSTEYGNGSLVGKNFQKGFIEKIASNLIAHGVTVQEWISVKDRLPDKRGEYLCYYKFEPDSPDVVCENTYQGSGLWLSEMDKVTHWQPMPQPPKGE